MEGQGVTLSSTAWSLLLGSASRQGGHHRKREHSLHVTKGKRLDEAAEFISDPSGEFTVTCTTVLTNLHRGPTARKPRALPAQPRAHSTESLLVSPGLTLDLTALITYLNYIHLAVCHWTK